MSSRENEESRQYVLPGYMDQPDVPVEPVCHISDQFSASVTRYFMDLLPVPIQMSGIVSAAGSLEAAEDLFDTATQVDWTARIGLGRMVDVTPVAKATAAGKILEADLSPDKIIDAARIIAKSNQYHYVHKENYNKEYYGSIAEILGLSDQVMDVQRAIIDTRIISSREIGWTATASYFQGYGLELFNPHLRLNGDIGIPIGFDMQLSPSLWFDTEFSDSPGYSGGLNLGFAIDHTTDWNSYARVSVQGSVATEADPHFWYSLYLSTQVQLFNRLSCGLAIWLG